MKRVFATRAKASRVFLPVALAGVLIASETEVTFCVCRFQLYRPGADAAQLYRPGSVASDIYRPGADANNKGCC